MKKSNIWIVVLVVSAALVLWLIFLKVQGTGGAYAVVTVDKELIGEYSLSENKEIRLEGSGGGYNMLKIQDGSAQVTDASCPDHVCVKQGSKQKNGETIVCLPNRVVVEIKSEKQPGLDSIVR